MWILGSICGVPSSFDWPMMKHGMLTKSSGVQAMYSVNCALMQGNCAHG